MVEGVGTWKLAGRVLHAIAWPRGTAPVLSLVVGASGASNLQAFGMARDTLCNTYSDAQATRLSLYTLLMWRHHTVASEWITTLARILWGS